MDVPIPDIQIYFSDLTSHEIEEKENLKLNLNTNFYCILCMINKHLNMCQHDCTTCLFIVLQVFMKEFGI